MNLDKVEFYNVGALEELPGMGANGLMRIPVDVRNKLNNRAKFIGMDSVGCEVRFITDAPNVDIYLSCLKPEFAERGAFKVFKGNFEYKKIELEVGVTQHFRLTPPPSFDTASENALNDNGFASDVWRIVCERGTTIFFHGVNTHGYDIRPPKKEEKPKHNWLAYGSSITNATLDGYVHFAARQLKIEVQNKGMSGSCHLEKEIVDYFVDECEWDFATCELGVNARGCMEVDEFEKRASYLIDKFAATGKPVVIISIFTNNRSKTHTKESNPTTDKEEAFNEILFRLVENKKLSNLSIINGVEIMNDFTGLSADLLHPSSYGHAVMGMNLVQKLKDIIPALNIS